MSSSGCLLSKYALNSSVDKIQQDKLSKDHCLCRGIANRNKICSNILVRREQYNKQGFTEFQDFTNNQKKNGGPYWKQTDLTQY